MKKYLIILLFAFSCSEEDITPTCAASREACKNLLRQMDAATTAQEKEQLYQFYLTEKHFSDNHCK